MKSQWHLRSAVGFLILLLSTLCAIAQTRQPPARTGAAGAGRMGVLTGKVVDDTGQPLANANVHVRVPNTRGVTGTTTNREGVFKVDVREGVSYDIGASLPAYTSKPREAGSGPPTLYRLGDSPTLVLIKGGVITGTVTTSNGEPLVTIPVRVSMIRDQNGRSFPSGLFTREGTTDDRGVYRIYSLPPGTYIVGTDSTNDYSETGVNAYASYIPTYAPSSNRETAEEITVRAGTETSNVDIRHRGERGSSISGTVSGGRNDLQRFSVVLTSSAAGVPERHSYPQPGSQEFAFEGVPEGDYHLIAVYYLTEVERALSEPRLINLRGADIGGIELTPAPLGSISGRVVLEESKAPECTDKRPPVFSETFISAWHRDTEAARRLPRFVWSMGAPVNPNSEGNLTLRHLAPSQYFFAARFSARDWYLQSITITPTPPTAKTPSTARPIDATRRWTTVKSGDRLSGLTVTLAQGAASLRGLIATAEGEALPERLVVYLVPAEPEQAEEVLRYFEVPVTPEGIALNNVPPGRYWIMAQPAPADAQSPLTKLRAPDATELRSTLRRAAEAAKTEVELKPCQHVTGFRLNL